VGDAIRGRQLGVRHPHAEAVDAMLAGAKQERPRLSHQPDAEPAALQRQPGTALELALLVSQQVTEESLGHGLAALAASPLWPHDARAHLLETPAHPRRSLSESAGGVALACIRRGVHTCPFSGALGHGTSDSLPGYQRASP
jgi:hypothetical protein